MKNKYRIGIWISDSPIKQLLLAMALFIGAFLFVCLINHTVGLSRNLVNMLSPVPMKEVIENTSTTDTWGNPWVVSISYFIGLIVFSGVLIATITNMIRTTGERYISGTAHYRFKDHILFLGYDELMIGTLKNVLDEKMIVVVAVPDNAASIRSAIYQHLTKAERKQVLVIQSSRTNVEDLKGRVWATKADRIFIIGQPNEPTHDAENLKCLGLIAALCSNKNKSDLPTCMYYLRNQATFYLIHRQKLQPEQFQQEIVKVGLIFDKQKVDDFVLHSEPFNFYESMSRHLLFGSLTGKEYISFGQTINRQPHFVIIGMSAIGTALARTILMSAHFPKQRLRITFIDENAYREMQYFIGRHRTFFDNCHYSFRNPDNETVSFEHEAALSFIDVDVEFVQCGMAHPAIMDYITPSDSVSLNIAICTDDLPKNMATALYLPRIVLESGMPIWVYQNGYNSMVSFLKHRIYKNVRTFSTNDYFVENRKDSKEWRLAKAVANGFDRRFSKQKQITEWHKIQPKNRWSSLYGALSKIISMQAIGKSIDHPVQLTDEEKRLLAVTEHNRWNVEKLLNGWIPATPEQLEALRLLPAKDVLNEDFVHHFIVPYSQLEQLTYIDEDVLKKDDAQIDDVVNELKKINNEKFNG